MHCADKKKKLHVKRWSVSTFNLINLTNILLNTKKAHVRAEIIKLIIIN
jgi:hypothetical protein